MRGPVTAPAKNPLNNLTNPAIPACSFVYPYGSMMGFNNATIELSSPRLILNMNISSKKFTLLKSARQAFKNGVRWELAVYEGASFGKPGKKKKGAAAKVDHTAETITYNK